MMKTLSFRDLLARIRAGFRRQRIEDLTGVQHTECHGYRFNGWRVERHAQQLLSPDGNVVSLTEKEHALLLAFLEAPRQLLTREHLLKTTNIHEDLIGPNIDVQILWLRRKLETDARTPQLILTRRAMGYLFAATVECSRRAAR
jgi:two-component system OmpR family response regulator